MSGKTFSRFFLKIAGLILFCAVSFYALFLAYGYKYDVVKLDVRKTSIIDLDARVNDVEVFLNAQSVYHGDLPYQIKDVAPGTAQLLLRKSGFLPWKTTVQVRVDFVSKITNILLVPEDTARPSSIEAKGSLPRQEETTFQFVKNIDEKLAIAEKNSSPVPSAGLVNGLKRPNGATFNNDGQYYMRDGMLFYFDDSRDKTTLLDQSFGYFSSLRLIAGKNYTFLVLSRFDKTSVLYLARHGKILGAIAENIGDEIFVNNLDQVIFSDKQNQLFIFGPPLDSSQSGEKILLHYFNNDFSLAGWFDDAHLLYRVGKKLYIADIPFSNVYELWNL